MSEEANRRRYPRINYPCSITVWRMNQPEEVVMAHTANVGAGSLFVHLNQRMFSGVRVEVKIEFPKAEEAFKCFGKVLRCQDPLSHDEQKFFAVAIEFEDLKPDQQETLDAIISSMLAQEAKRKP